MLLLQSIAAFGEIGNYRKQQGERPKVFEYFEKGPTAQPIGDPHQTPFNCIEWDHPWTFCMSADDRPVFGLRPLLIDRHLSSLVKREKCVSVFAGESRAATIARSAP